MKTVVVSAMVIIGLAGTVAALRTNEPAASPVASLRVLKIGDMGVARAAHQATLLTGGQVLITGGCGGRGCAPFHRSAEIHDPASGGFRTVAPMALARGSHTATLLADGRVLIAGGCSDQGATASAEIYDAATDAWSAVGDMTEPRCSHTAVPLLDGRVFITGGGGGRLGHLASAEIFDPATSTFSAVGRMRSNHYLATRLGDGRILLTGGQSDRGDILASATVFDPATGSFQPTGDMSVPRVKHAGALLPDGRVLIIGGSDQRGYAARFTSTEIYDVGSGRFSPGPDLRWGRHKLRDAVVVLPSGAVVVAGGAVRPEVYDHADRVFVAVEGALSGPQMFATATVLADGTLLVLGGYDERIQASASAWSIGPRR